MQLHWDGNNSSVDERNLSAALGAGVTPVTVDHTASKAVRDWIWTLPPPKYPYAIDAGLRPKARRSIHDSAPSAIALAASEPARSSTINDIGTDPYRLNSYTHTFAANQVALFPESRYRFTHFRKTTAMPIIHWTASGRGRLTCTMARYRRSGICCEARRTGLGSLAGATMSTTKKRSGSSPIRPKPNAQRLPNTIPPSPAMETAATSMGRSSPTRRSGRWSST